MARRVYEDQIPPFMSVFDLDAETIADRDTVTVVDPKMVEEPKGPALANQNQSPRYSHGTLPLDAPHKHRNSTSTQISESTDSSPTTTLSTSDSSPLSDPSPSSSPDSPVGLIPLNNYPATSFNTQMSVLPPAHDAQEKSTFFGNINVPPTPYASEQPMLPRPVTSPGPRRPKNMKGLSIQPPAAVNGSQASMVSEPGSPSFIKPNIPAMKRKPSQLSLKTNTNDLMIKPVMEVPPSPAMGPIMQRRALKHSTSTPHMLTSIKTSTFAPPGGMTFPKVLERNENGLSEVLRPMKSSMNLTFESTISEEEPSPIRPQMANRSDCETYEERENNEDQKTPGYPDGPIAIYSDNVFLYSEPTADEASGFDLVINVAREVRNPFEPVQKACRPPFGDLSPIPDTATTDGSFATALEFQASADEQSETPTTPKANPFKRPEYIHMPWDHNTDIAPDLMHLCETIENRTKEGKKVLVHCQQGASRSASLIIAYGLYQRPELSVNDAYYAAQAKSQWISPNMKLMYSLQDFQKEMSKKRFPSASARLGSRAVGRSPTKHRLTLSADAFDVPHKEPRTAPLPGKDGESYEQPSPRNATLRPRGNSTPMPPAISPGPQTAPPNLSWQQTIEQEAPPPPPAPTIEFGDLPERPSVDNTASLDYDMVDAPTGRLDLSDRPPPTPGFGPPAGFGFQSMSFPSFQEQVSRQPPPPDKPSVQEALHMAPEYPDDEALMSPRAETMTENPLHNFTAVAGMSFTTGASPESRLFSPRATMFPRDPRVPFGRPQQLADPRSPPTKGETPITRSIDDFL